MRKKRERKKERPVVKLECNPVLLHPNWTREEPDWREKKLEKKRIRKKRIREKKTEKRIKERRKTGLSWKEEN